MAWHHNDLTERAAAQAFPALATAIAGYSTPWNEQQHVNYFDAQGNIHELYYSNGHWLHNDLFQRVVPPFQGFPGDLLGLSSFATTWDNRQHIAYIDTAGHINLLYYNGKWQHADLLDYFTISGDPGVLELPAQNGLIAAFGTPWNEAQHIFYVAAGFIRELFYTGHWYVTDLAKKFGAQIISIINTHGYATPWNNSMHVILLGANGQIRHLYYSDHWDERDLRAADKESREQFPSALHCHITTWNNQQHVIFFDANRHVNRLYFVDGIGWLHEDLTTLATAANGGVAIGVPRYINNSPLLNSAVTSHSTPWNTQQHVNYIDPLGFINELWYDGHTWRHNNLTVLARGAENAKYVADRVAITSYVTSWNNQEHVMYVDVNGHINEIYNA
jgi:hypothetical protein